MIGIGEPDTVFRYRMIEERWWSSWSAKEDGYLGCFTRTHGWRWLKVRLAQEPPTVMTLDPQAMDANFMQWDVRIIAAQPYWCKRQEMSTWINDGEGDGPIPSTPWDELEELIEDILEGLDSRCQQSDTRACTSVRATSSSPTAAPRWRGANFWCPHPGRAWIQDGPGGRMIELPLLTPS